VSVVHHLHARPRPIGAFQVRRVLPAPQCRKVGPWVFLDHFGPLTLAADAPMDIRPHPHVGLSTVSYLLEGSIEHRDSLGGHAIIEPGEIHWMRAGHGIVHSERTPESLRGRESRSHGLQLWCAHPDGEEDQEPAFESFVDLPQFTVEGVHLRLLAGHGWDRVSPVRVTSPLVFALAELVAGQSLRLPDHPERCVYALSGAVAVDGDAARPHDMLVVDAGAQRVHASSDAVVVILGGDPIGPRHMWWNLVHSDPDRLRDQAQRWRKGEFPTIPGDADEFIEAPEGP
jgi:redox-sensitive bicupin YhaK (pirin superfamily)